MTNLIKRKKYLSLFLLCIFFAPRVLFAGHLPVEQKDGHPTQISLKDYQLLFNGKEWYNRYTAVRGDQFLFSKDFLDGTVVMSGRVFSNLKINYDIYNDEIICPKADGKILQLNKEMVDSFAVSFNFKLFTFKNIDADSIKGLSGYVYVLYTGKSMLCIKYKKGIDPLAVDDRYDQFFQTSKIYVVDNGIANQVTGKRDLFSLWKSYKNELKAFIKKNGLSVSKKTPENFVPVIKYYDSLRK